MRQTLGMTPLVHGNERLLAITVVVHVMLVVTDAILHERPPIVVPGPSHVLLVHILHREVRGRVRIVGSNFYATVAPLESLPLPFSRRTRRVVLGRFLVANLAVTETEQRIQDAIWKVWQG